MVLCTTEAVPTTPSTTIATLQQLPKLFEHFLCNSLSAVCLTQLTTQFISVCSADKLCYMAALTWHKLTMLSGLIAKDLVTLHDLEVFLL